MENLIERITNGQAIKLLRKSQPVYNAIHLPYHEYISVLDGLCFIGRAESVKRTVHGESLEDTKFLFQINYDFTLLYQSEGRVARAACKILGNKIREMNFPAGKGSYSGFKIATRLLER